MSPGGYNLKKTDEAFLSCMQSATCCFITASRRNKLKMLMLDGLWTNRHWEPAYTKPLSLWLRSVQTFHKKAKKKTEFSYKMYTDLCLIRRVNMVQLFCNQKLSQISKSDAKSWRAYPRSNFSINSLL